MECDWCGKYAEHFMHYGPVSYPICKACRPPPRTLAIAASDSEVHLELGAPAMAAAKAGSDDAK